jgi:hypothetical protein
MLISALVGAISASLVILGALRVLLIRTVGRRWNGYSRLSRLGTGAQLPFFTSVLGEPPAVQRTVVQEETTEAVGDDDPRDFGRAERSSQTFTVSVFIDRDYYVQTISDDDQTVLAYSVTTRSRRFRPSLRPVPALGFYKRLRLRRFKEYRRLQPRIVLGKTRFSDLDAPEPEHFAPPRLRLRIGAHNFDYSETAYFGNPGRYQSFAWTASDVARQGPLGSFANVGSGLSPDRWTNFADPNDPDWSELAALHRFRRETAITTYTVCDVRLQIEKYPLSCFGVGEHEVRTLW